MWPVRGPDVDEAPATWHGLQRSMHAVTSSGDFVDACVQDPPVRQMLMHVETSIWLEIPWVRQCVCQWQHCTSCRLDCARC